jgi:hypothetical protein
MNIPCQACEARVGHKSWCDIAKLQREVEMYKKWQRQAAERVEESLGLIEDLESVYKTALKAHAHLSIRPIWMEIREKPWLMDAADALVYLEESKFTIDDLRLFIRKQGVRANATRTI